MQKADLWKEIVRQNPTFADSVDNVQISSKGIRKFFDLVWEKAYGEGFQEGIDSETKKNHDYSQSIPDLFGDLFGKKN